ncbi:hypothetical protein GCM10023206_19770 [Acinetobacter puyangensis]|uniref:Uncharacterized protein n=2 Tax=Acinetobacter puyangensis TaxID=1096779 RepID=A0A240EC13_9GAMM|nr:hypothetical protein [Acinetobacter puyangensis]SNX46244.1 hypothetical protein SAMN05421731_10976 [Acinetobacter puyangensis]
MHSKAQALLEAHLAFIKNQLQQGEIVTQEVLGFFDWFKTQKITDLWCSQHITALLQQQILLTPATDHLIQQIQQHITLALQHPHNEHTTIEEVLPVETIDQIAQYIASKSNHRKKLIKQLVHNPVYIELISNLVQQSLQDYVDQSVVAKKIPGVGSFMKMGKSVIERATDRTFDDALRLYLHKNFNKLSQLSEKLITQHLDDDKLYQLQAKLWHKIKKAPLSTLQHYIVIEDLPQTVAMGEQVWNHIRQTDYLQAQITSGVDAWVERHAQDTFAQALQDINIDENLLRTELYQLIMPILNQVIDQGYLLDRARFYLEQFYNSDEVKHILDQ